MSCSGCHVSPRAMGSAWPDHEPRLPMPHMSSTSTLGNRRGEIFKDPGISQPWVPDSFLLGHREASHTEDLPLPPKTPIRHHQQHQRIRLSPKGCSTAREIRGRENTARTLRKTEVPCLLGKHRKDSQQALGLQVEEKDQEEEADTPLGADSVSHTHTSAQSSG